MFHAAKGDDKLALVLDDSIASTGKNADDLASLIETFEDKKPAYAVFNLRGKDTYDRPVEKMVLINWCPDGTRAVAKMLHASALSMLIASFIGVESGSFDATDVEDITMDALVKHCT